MFDLLLAKLAPGAKRVHQRVQLAIDDPATYGKKFRQKLEDRNAEEEPIDPWLQLVDALEDEALSWGVDWRASADEVVHALSEVLARKKLNVKWLTAPYDPGAHLATRTDEFITWCGRALSAHGLQVVTLDIDSDSFELTVIARADVAALQKAAKKAGGSISSFAPKTPLSKRLPSITFAAPKKFQSVATQRLWSHRDEFVRVRGVVADSERGSTLYDLRSWPPKKRALGDVKLDYATSPRGDEVVQRVMHKIIDGAWSKEATGTFRVNSKELISKIPSEFDLHRAHFVGNLLVLFPTEPSVRCGHRLPLVWNGKTLAPAKGLPAARAKKGNRRDQFPSFLRIGLVELGNGEEFLVWEGKLFEPHGVAFRQVKQPKGLEVPTYDFFQGAPGPKGTRSFVHLSERKVLLTSLDDGPSRVLARLEHNAFCPRAAGEHGVVVRVGRSGKAKAPLLVLAHFDGRPPTDIAASAFGVRSDDTVQAWGVEDDWLWVAHERAIKRLPVRAFL